MLLQLKIKDFAIIDDLTIKFRPGLNVLTGETGAGKSIVVDAFGLALGERAQTDLIRTGRNETVIEAFLDISAHPVLERLGIPLDDGIILRRNLSSAGKSRAYINDTMINVQTLLEVGETLVDIHGQHEHQSLLSTDNQRTMLDAYAKLTELRASFEKLFHEVQSIKGILSKFRSDLRERNERIELLRFQINEIDSAALKSGEKERLIEEKAILSNLAKLNELTDLAHSLLYSGEGSVQDKLSSAHSAIKEISVIDNSAAEVLGLIEGARPLIDDAVISLRRYKDRYDVDPNRLEEIEDRLDLIKKFEKKYGEGIDSILQFRENAEKELEGLTLSDERLQDIEKTLTAKEMQLNEEALKLSLMRKEAAERLEAEVISALRELAIEKAEFRVAVRECPISPAGIDNIEFLFSANKGEPPKPLSKTASGGELSRIMLALKETFAEVDKIPVLIFDEVDAGIGGRTAESVGISLKKLSKKHQVLCITHLPQIAAMADHHIVIEKAQKQDGVSVKVKEPSQREREEEIARMLSGKITDISVKHAKELIERVS
ncbi:MAG: DNA repair protein RecN [Nitrospirota bacterium]